jgi:transcription initiation factor TFIIB
MSKLITKKTKRKKNKKKNRNLWKMFDTEVLNKDNVETELECLFRDSKISERNYCDMCNKKLSIGENGFLVCSNDKCGIVYKDSLEQGAEWRYYGAADNNMRDPTRCGMPINPLLKESSYGCKVACRGNTTYEMKKIKRYTDWQSMPYKEKTIYDEFQRIKIMSKNAGIPKIMVDEALRQHKKISEMKTFRGCNRDGIIAASVYLACRIHNFPRTAREIATIFNLDNSSSTKGCKNAMHLLNSIEQTYVNNNKTKLCKTIPSSFIERYCSRLNLNKEITKVCLFVAINIQTNNIIPENTPHSVAAGIVYFVSQSCHLNITKRDVNNVSEISEVTINKCYKKLYVLKEKLIPPVILNKYTY